MRVRHFYSLQGSILFLSEYFSKREIVYMNISFNIIQGILSSDFLHYDILIKRTKYYICFKKENDRFIYIIDLLDNELLFYLF